MSVYTIEKVFDVPDGPTAEHTAYLAIKAPDGQVIQRIWYHPAMEEPARRVAEVWTSIYEELGHPEGYFRDSVMNTPEGDICGFMNWTPVRQRAQAGDTAQ